VEAPGQLPSLTPPLNPALLITSDQSNLAKAASNLCPLPLKSGPVFDIASS